MEWFGAPSRHGLADLKGALIGHNGGPAIEPSSAIERVLSVSGGKDSTAIYCLAVERGLKFRAVMADTGNEDQRTYDAIHNLPLLTGGPTVEIVKNDFSARILAKRDYIATHWPKDLQAGVPGAWEWREDTTARDEWRVRFRAWKSGGKIGDKPLRIEAPMQPPPMPLDPFNGRQAARPMAGGTWIWRQGYKPLSFDEAMEVVAVAMEWMIPTGIPYLDLCIWKGRFPSRKAQFCTDELKVQAINTQVTGPLLAAGHTVISWQGTRRTEGGERKYLQPFQCLNTDDIAPNLPGQLYAYRPILTWSVDEVFAYGDRFVPRNPLYALGCSRVGCFPCINCTKAELALVASAAPLTIDKLEEWEVRVSRCSKRGMTTFFNIVNDPVMAAAWGWSERLGERLELSPATHGVRQMIEWAKTDRGGRQFNLFPEVPVSCATAGFCE